MVQIVIEIDDLDLQAVERAAFKDGGAAVGHHDDDAGMVGLAAEGKMMPEVDDPGTIGGHVDVARLRHVSLDWAADIFIDGVGRAQRKPAS